MLKDITFGQYIESGSVIHKLDARTKILLLILSIVFIFLAKNLISLAVFLIFTALVLIFSKIKISTYLKNLKAILPIIIFTAVLNLFYSDGSKELLTFWKI
ncbi:MAG: energy-coupling factor transporter transmembrane protein EcfT, partial [Clostridia bacterium]|nr:energy-coupling factor transporter transmembrane protein EcfT [Clostridia bacterium]